MKIILASAIILYVIPLIAVYVFQRSFLYIPSGDYIPPAAFNMSQVEEVKLNGADQTQLTSWWLPPVLETAPVIMFFHGNGSSVFSNYDVYADLNREGYGVWGVAYPGYPGSGGKPTQDGLIAAAQAQYDWLIAQGVAPDRIVFYGTSLGAGVAAQLSLTRRPAFLIMEAPFTSAIDMGRETMPVFPVKYLMKDTYKSAEALEQIDVPLLWLHGTKDEVIRFTMGQELYAGYDGPKDSFVVDGGMHTNLWGLGGREKILETLAKL